MRNKIKLHSYHTFLIIPFVVLFLFNQNRGQVWPNMLVRPIIIGELLTLVFFGLFYMLLKNRLKAGVFVSLFVMGCIQYGVIYDFFERMYYAGTWPLQNIHRYLLFAFIAFFGILFFYFKKSPRSFVRINLLLNMMLTILLLFNILQVVRGKEVLRTDVAQAGVEAELVLPHVSNKPDIFYIILDGYASAPVLKKYYQFDNSPFIHQLQNLGFAIADSARSNYYYTSHSLASTLNMDFLSSPNAAGKIKRNRLFGALKREGYKIYNLESGYAVTGEFDKADSTVYIKGPNEFEKSLLRTTILRLDDLFGFIPRLRLVSQFETMFKMPEIKSSPKFVFIHIVAPHPPFVFNSDGSVKIRGVSEHSWEPATSYISQLKYVNTQITKLTEKILTKSEKPIIIIQADHGAWISANTPEQVFEARAGILYAIYPCKVFPVKDKVTSVNTFRMVLDTLFKAQLGSLPDSLAGRSDLLQDPILLKKSNVTDK